MEGEHTLEHQQEELHQTINSLRTELEKSNKQETLHTLAELEKAINKSRSQETLAPIYEQLELLAQRESLEIRNVFKKKLETLKNEPNTHSWNRHLSWENTTQTELLKKAEIGRTQASQRVEQLISQTSKGTSRLSNTLQRLNKQDQR